MEPILNFSTLPQRFRPLQWSAIFLLIFASSCSSDLGIDGIDFACEDDDDCSEGYFCVETEGGDQRVCAEEPEEEDPDPKEPDDCDCTPDEDQSYTCVDGECVYESCEDGTANCGGTSDECDTDLDTIDNCGGCDLACESDEDQSYTCDGGQCIYESCEDGTANCGGPSDECDTDLDTVDHCGGCDLTCEFSTETPNADAACDDGTCVAECHEGWHNDDGDFETGCGCSVSSDPSQLPKCEAIYVDPVTGDNGDGDGTEPDRPFETLSAAINRARQDEVSLLMVATGTYVSDQTIDFPLSIVGGLTPDADWQRVDDDHRSIIEHGETDDGGITTTLVIDRDGDFSEMDVELRYLELRPPETPQIDDIDDWDAGDASVATLRIQNVHNATTLVSDSLIEGGVAADGLHGANATSPDSSEDAHGEAGAEGDDYSGDSRDGGAPGTPSCSEAGAGGKGGDTHSCEGYPGAPDDGESGEDGESTDGGAGGEAGDGSSACQYNSDSVSESQGSGSHGELGQSGHPGEGGGFDEDSTTDAHLGTVDPQGHWTARFGHFGHPGEAGAGGGGGGAAVTKNIGAAGGVYRFGGAGGGGGAGGCAGDGGAPGAPGGASFTVIVSDAELVFADDISIEIGRGGHGGDGGQGACGSAGGLGGPGGDSGFGTSYVGGCGAMGGHGGIGGGGAAGHGGPSIGIATIEEGEVSGDYDVDEDSPGSQGGSGGTPLEPSDCFDDDYGHDSADGAIDCSSQVFHNLDDASQGHGGADGDDGAVLDLMEFSTAADEE